MLNYGVYSLLIHQLPMVQPLVAVIFGSLSATLYSFFGYSRFVFRHRRPKAGDTES